MRLFHKTARPGKQEVNLFFGELKEGALLDRCRTDTHKIVLTLVDGQPVGVRLESLGTQTGRADFRAQAQPPRREAVTLERQFMDGSVERIRVFEDRDL